VIWYYLPWILESLEWVRAYFLCRVLRCSVPLIPVLLSPVSSFFRDTSQQRTNYQASLGTTSGRVEWDFPEYLPLATASIPGGAVCMRNVPLAADWERNTIISGGVLRKGHMVLLVLLESISCNALKRDRKRSRLQNTRIP